MSEGHEPGGMIALFWETSTTFACAPVHPEFSGCVPRQGYHAPARALAHLGSLKRALGDLDRITAWLRVFSMVNVAPGFNETPRVTNGYSDLILELYGHDVGMHAAHRLG